MKGKRTIRLILATLLVLAGLVLAAWYTAPALLLWYAEKGLASRNLARAESALGLLLALEPDHQRAHFLYAKVLRHLGKFSEADLQLGLADKLGLPKEEGRREFGLLYAGWDFAHAKGALQVVLKEHPDDLEVVQALAHGCLQQKRPAEAETYFTRWLELRPDEIEPRVQRGLLYMDTRQFANAMADFRIVLEQSPENFRARLGLGLSLLSEARVSQAERELRLCQQQRADSSEPLIGLAECAMERGDFTNAYTLLGKALELDSGSLPALQDLANLNLSQRRHEEAVRNFTEILRLAPNDMQALLKLAQTLNYLGRKEEAKQYEERYKQLDDEASKRLKSLQERR